MIKIAEKFIKEPLVHFLLLGAILYIYYAQQSSENILTQKDSQEKIITVQKDLNSTEEEVRRKIYDAILLQEAYALELEKHDTLITTRLIEKMESVLLASKRFEEPSEAALLEYYKKNIAEYSTVKSIDLSYIKIEKEQREKIERIIAVAPEIIAQKMPKLLSQTPAELESRFGRYFSHIVLRERSKIWSGVIAAKDGNYLIYINKKVVGEPMAFDLIEDRVYRDYKAEFLQRVRNEAYKKLEQNYKVELL